MDAKPNITCAVCGENDYHLKEGFYYCNECGTKSEQVRAVEVENDNDFDTMNNSKHRNVLKIKSDKPDTPELTSWECYNYILRGMVEELIEMGAKDELKPMVFQIWAAFLRSKEVAFFSRKHVELPKLGVRFEPRDATILYNHAEQRKKIRIEKKENASIASGSRREWRKQMKKFDQSQYESSLTLSQSICSQSIMSQSSLGTTSFNSSGSAQSNRAIQLKFSSKARKVLKKKMPIAHLKKHEQDFNHTLTCHKINAQENELKHSERSKELNMKLVYAILAVALNLIEDDIQLVDLLRFISEGHISTINLERFFPSNIISEKCKNTLKTYRLHYKVTEFSTTNLRAHCKEVCKAIHIKFLKTPDLFKLVQRYTTELCLPADINTFIERLINLHPPIMPWEHRISTPNYESRAMAYIIFTLKLLFGIDGRKEKQISRSAKRVNAELAEMNLEHYDELFVWDDWAEYIELRKVFLSSKHLGLCKQFKQKPTRDMYLQHLEDRANEVENKLSKNMLIRQANMSAVFQHFLNVGGGEREDKPSDNLNFTPSLTPCHSYLNRLKLDPKINETIPKCLNFDHSKRSLYPLLQPTKLKETFSKCDKKLKIVRISCTSKRHFVGIFRNTLLKHTFLKPIKVNLTEDKKPWESMLEAEKPPDSIFQTFMESYGRRSLANFRKKGLNNQNIKEGDPSYILKYEPPSEINNPNCSGSFGLLDKDDMNTIDVRLTAPRRNLGRVNLFADLSEDEADSAEEMEQSQDESFANISETPKTTTKLKISNLDCWLLMGQASELIETQANELKHNFQLTFFWLLETCALTIGVDWRELYDELMVLETFFAHTIEPLDDFKDRIIFKSDNEIKHINKMVRHFQSYW